MSTQPKAMRLADALAQEQAEQAWVCPDSPEHRYEKPGHCEDCGKTLVMAQAEPVQEPVAVVRWNDIGHISWRAYVMLPDDTPLYTAPPQRKPLTEEEIDRIWRDGGWAGRPSIGLIRAIERALEEKNGR